MAKASVGRPGSRRVTGVRFVYGITPKFGKNQRSCPENGGLSETVRSCRGNGYGYCLKNKGRSVE